MLGRREFLSSLLLPSISIPVPGLHHPRPATTADCWLQVVIPFLVEDAPRDIHSEIVLTASSFTGKRGFEDLSAGNDYRIHLFDASGKRIALEDLERGGSLKRIHPLRAQLINLDTLLSRKEAFWGSALIEVLPRSRALRHMGDLFSTAFVRWHLNGLFDCIHANPNPPQLLTGAYYSTMPFPPAESLTVGCTLFNPSDRLASGRIRLLDTKGTERKVISYELEQRATRIFSLGSGKLEQSPESVLESRDEARSPLLQSGGTISVENHRNSPKCFSYMLIRSREHKDQFAVEHPLFQGDFSLTPENRVPFDSQGKLRARTLVFTPLWFAGARQRGLTLESSAYLSSGKALGESLWVQPFVTGPEGTIHWTSTRDRDFLSRAGESVDRGCLRLRSFASFALHAKEQGLDSNFAGGLALATSPETNHSLMKVQVAVKEWNSFALSHFRPGSRLARPLQTIEARGGLASDYLVTGIRVEGEDAQPRSDSLLAFYNIEFEEERSGSAQLQLFGAQGLIKEAKLGSLPPLGSRHIWVSQLFPGIRSSAGEVWTLRMTDEAATVVVSAIHFDFQHRQLAIDHGSDRFSTYLDYSCL